MSVREDYNIFVLTEPRSSFAIFSLSVSLSLSLSPSDLLLFMQHVCHRSKIKSLSLAMTD